MILVGKEIQLEKKRLYVAQQGKCVLCERDLDENVSKNSLDHDHTMIGKNAGKVRGLLCCYCNPLEGQIKHKFNSSGLKNKIEITDFLKNLISYYEKDYSQNMLHPSFVNDKIKLFKSLNKPEMIQELNNINIYPTNETKEELISLYKKGYRKFLKANK